MEGQFTIRRATIEDAQRIIDVRIESIRQICSSAYSPEDIEVMAHHQLKIESWRQKIQRDYFWVIWSNGEVQGFCHLAFMDEAHAELLEFYLSPKIRGRGAGRELMNRVMEEVKGKRVKRLELLSTLNAQKFYEKLGFEVLREPTTIMIAGRNLRCVPMLLLL